MSELIWVKSYAHFYTCKQGKYNMVLSINLVSISIIWNHTSPIETYKMESEVKFICLYCQL